MALINRQQAYTYLEEFSYKSLNELKEIFSNQIQDVDKTKADVKFSITRIKSKSGVRVSLRLDYYIEYNNKFWIYKPGKMKKGIVIGDKETGVFVLKNKPKCQVYPYDKIDIAKDEIVIYTKPCQAGKTHDCVVVRFALSKIKNRIPILIVPPLIANQQQTKGRIFEGININFLDSNPVLSEFQKNQLKNKVPQFKKGEIGIFDSSAEGSEECGTNTKETLERVRKGEIKAFVVLNNKRGLDRLLALLVSMTEKDKGVDIVIDEVHNVLDINESPNYNENKVEFEDYIQRCRNRKGVVNTNMIPFTQEEKYNFIMEKFLEKKGKWTISGLTATVSYLSQNEHLESLGIKFPVVKMDAPDCYIGYDKCEKKVYNGKEGTKEAFNQILNLEKDNNDFVIMHHAGNKQNFHKHAAKVWGETCEENGKDPKLVGSMIDNANGYSHLDCNGNTIQVVKKGKDFSEPWQAVKHFKKRTPILGIFGDTCMAESTTYQKCDKENNVYISHLVNKSIKGVTLKQMTKVIQKVGRINGNDSNGSENKRTIWFASEKEKIKFENGFGLENRLQIVSGECLTKTDYKEQELIAKMGKLDLDGNDKTGTPAENTRSNGYKGTKNFEESKKLAKVVFPNATEFVLTTEYYTASQLGLQIPYLDRWTKLNGSEKTEIRNMIKNKIKNSNIKIVNEKSAGCYNKKQVAAFNAHPKSLKSNGHYSGITYGIGNNNETNNNFGIVLRTRDIKNKNIIVFWHDQEGNIRYEKNEYKKE